MWKNRPVKQKQEVAVTVVMVIVKHANYLLFFKHGYVNEYVMNVSRDGFFILICCSHTVL